MILIISVLASLFIVFIFLYKFNSKSLILFLLPLSIFMGAFYYSVWNNYVFYDDDVVYDEKIDLSGEVISYPAVSSFYQTFKIKDEAGHIFQVKLRDLTKIYYGDYVSVNGEIKKVDIENKYLLRQKIIGVVSYPDLLSLETKNKFIFRKFLYSWRDKFSGVFNKTLPIKDSVLASGILLGKNSADFSYEFKKFMENSGTTHIVALSGYNIMILLDLIFYISAFFISRKKGVPIALFIILLFVLMTGAESSVVRAAIMGALIVLAEIFSRVYNFINASAFTAFVMILINPMVLNFDVGFILSFCALFGIVYVSRLIPIYKKNGFLKVITKTISETLGAQIMVLPILIIYFHKFSVFALLSNALILPVIPFAMGISFIQGLLGMIWMPLANFVSIILSPLLSYVVKLIEFFGSVSVVESNAGLFFAIFYYLFLAFFLVKFNRKNDYEYFA